MIIFFFFLLAERNSLLSDVFKTFYPLTPGSLNWCYSYDSIKLMFTSIYGKYLQYHDGFLYVVAKLAWYTCNTYDKVLNKVNRTGVSNFKIRRDVTCNRLHALLRVTLTCACFAVIPYIHARFMATHLKYAMTSGLLSKSDKVFLGKPYKRLQFGGISCNVTYECYYKILTNLDELSFLTVFALPNDSKIGLACNSWASNSPCQK